MTKAVIDMLKNAPANSVDFKNTLKEATNLEIKTAKALMQSQTGCKGKIAACARELKKRGAENP